LIVLKVREVEAGYWGQDDKWLVATKRDLPNFGMSKRRLKGGWSDSSRTVAD